MLQVKASMRPVDLAARTQPFIDTWLAGLFGPGDASLTTFYADLDNALTTATGSQSNFLGDVAISMQLALPASVLAAWVQPRGAAQLKSDQMTLSRSLQASWKSLLPALFFQDLSQYQFNESIAALLVWSSIPISTSIDFDEDESTINRFNTDNDVYWNFPDAALREAIARDSHTVAALSGQLATIQQQLVEAGNSNAQFFAPSMAGRFIELALNTTGATLLNSLLFTEAQLVQGAADALKDSAATAATAATAPTQAITTLAQFAGAITDTFNNRVSSVYSGVSGRVVGPMLLVEATRALGGPGLTPAAMMTLYALKPGHPADLTAFVTGTLPAQANVALSQTLVSVGAGHA
jgi:hypothetical protein